MTIAVLQTGTIGPRTYEVRGPFGVLGFAPSAEFKYGETAIGDAEAEFVYVAFVPPTVPFTVRQGDLLTWDNNFLATYVSTTNSPRGQAVGTVFLGGRYGDAAPANFSALLPANGSYGIWVQRNGVSLIHVSSTATQGNVLTTTATAGQADGPAAPLAGSKTIRGAFVPYASVSFTGSTTNGSPTITLPSSLAGVYPGQAITGTGIPANSFIGSINGIPGGYTISLSSAATNGQPVNATATATGVSLTVNGYIEAYLRGPYVDNTN